MATSAVVYHGFIAALPIRSNQMADTMAEKAQLKKSREHDYEGGCTKYTVCPCQKRGENNLCLSFQCTFSQQKVCTTKKEAH